jgi:hypothetical protein
LEDHAHNEADLFWYFKNIGLPADKVDDFPEARAVYVFQGRDKQTYVIDEFPESPDVVPAQLWIDRIDEMYLTEYVEAPEDDFWAGVGSGYVMYHGTHEDRVEEIMSPGGILEARNETRGMSNRSMEAAVFLSADPGTANYHYDKVLAVDLGAMKADGYMPRAGGEEPLEEGELRTALAAKLGADDYYWEGDSSDGLSDDTVAIYGNIPNKYLTLLD